MEGEGRISCCFAIAARILATNPSDTISSCGNDMVVAIRRKVYDVLDVMERRAIDLMEEDLGAH